MPSPACALPPVLHSFVVPAYGQSRHLRDCLHSLRAQTYPSPIIMVTSTPFDGLDALAAENGAQLVVHSPNIGIGHDWNMALAQADTPWVTIAHQDDVYLPRFVERTLALAVRHPAASLLMTGYAELCGDRVRGSTPMLLVKRLLQAQAFLGREALSRHGARLRLLRFGCAIPCPAVTLNLAYGGVAFREDLRVNLDWDAWARLARQPGAFARVPEVLMLHRIHGGSETSAAIRAGVRRREDAMLFESLWPRPIARLLARAYTLSYETGTAI